MEQVTEQIAIRRPMSCRASAFLFATILLSAAPVPGAETKPPSPGRPAVPTLADCLAGAKGPAEIRQAARHLRIAAPVTRWDEAIPLGNGLMGGLLYGEGSQLRLSLDRGDLWDERPCPTVLKENFTWRHWLELREAGQWAELNELFDQPYSHPTPTKIPGGRLEVTLDGSQTIAAFSLDLASAVGRAELAGGQTAVECFYSAADGVVLVRVPRRPRSRGGSCRRPCCRRGWAIPRRKPATRATCGGSCKRCPKG